MKALFKSKMLIIMTCLMTFMFGLGVFFLFTPVWGALGTDETTIRLEICWYYEDSYGYTKYSVFLQYTSSAAGANDVTWIDNNNSVSSLSSLGVSIPYREGYEFLGLYQEENNTSSRQYYDASGNAVYTAGYTNLSRDIVASGQIDGDFQVFACWNYVGTGEYPEPEYYTMTFAGFGIGDGNDEIYKTSGGTWPDNIENEGTGDYTIGEAVSLYIYDAKSGYMEEYSTVISFAGFVDSSYQMWYDSNYQFCGGSQAVTQDIVLRAVFNYEVKFYYFKEGDTCEDNHIGHICDINNMSSSSDMAYEIWPLEDSIGSGPNDRVDVAYHVFDGYWTKNGDGSWGTQCIKDDGSWVEYHTYASQPFTLYAKYNLDLWTDYAVSPLGAGTSSNPYQIDSIYNLAWVAQQTNSGTTFYNKYFEQTNDYFDFSEDYYTGDGVTRYWVPIGTEANPFQGIYKGATHFTGGWRVSDMVTISTKYVGLFGYCGANSNIRSARIAHPIIHVSEDSDVYVGALAGYFAGTIDSCMAGNGWDSGEIPMDLLDIDVKSLGGDAYVGGLIGYRESNGMSYCDVDDGNISATSTGTTYVGGSVGYATNTLFHTGNNDGIESISITGNGSYVYLGGLVGYAKNSKVESAKIKDVVISPSPNSNNVYVGGFAGKIENTMLRPIGNIHIDNFKFNADDKSPVERTCNAGGIVGHIVGDVELTGDCSVNNSTINAVSNDDFSFAGGFAGRVDGDILLEDDCTVQNSSIYVKTNATGTSGYVRLGGFVGYVNGCINCNDNYIKILNCTLSVGEKNGTIMLDAIGGVVGFGHNSSLPVKIRALIQQTNFDIQNIVSSVMCGGVVGFSNWEYLTLSDCYLSNTSENKITGYAGEFGGLIGGNIGETTIDKCMVVIDIESNSTNDTVRIGGFIGVNLEESSPITITNSYFSGNISASSTNQPCLGGAFGSAKSGDSITDCLIRTKSYINYLDGHRKYASKALTAKCIILEENDAARRSYQPGGDWSNWGIVNGKPLPKALFHIAKASTCSTTQLRGLDLPYSLYDYD